MFAELERNAEEILQREAEEDEMRRGYSAAPLSKKEKCVPCPMLRGCSGAATLVDSCATEMRLQSLVR
jgi:hypothetical protein